MIIKNIKIVLLDKVIENGYIEIVDSKIHAINEGKYFGNDSGVVDGLGKIAMPGFIDIHTHGACGIDFMDAEEDEYKIIADSLYNEGITSFLATTLTSDHESLLNVCKKVLNAKEFVPSLLGIHLEGPYINKTYKGAQNEEFIREPDVNELKELIKISKGNVRLISMAPEMPNSLEFILEAAKNHITISAGHTNATFDDVEVAMKHGLTNITHAHNAMSKYDHKAPGVVAAALYFDDLYTECICDLIHVHPNTLKTFYKYVTSKRFMIITDSLSVKHSEKKEFQLFGLDCEVKNGAAYLKTGPLAGSILTMDQGLRNMRQLCGLSLVELARISSYNQAKSLHLEDRGELAVDKLADIVLLDENLNVNDVYKNGIKVK